MAFTALFLIKKFLNDLSDNAALLYFSKPEQFKPDTTMACEFGGGEGESVKPLVCLSVDELVS